MSRARRNACETDGVSPHNLPTLRTPWPGGEPAGSLSDFDLIEVLLAIRCRVNAQASLKPPIPARAGRTAGLGASGE